MELRTSIIFDNADGNECSALEILEESLKSISEDIGMTKYKRTENSKAVFMSFAHLTKMDKKRVELDELKNEKNKLNRKISTLKKALPNN